MSINSDKYTVIRGYITIDILWSRVLNFMYINSEKLQVIAANLWIKIKNRKVWLDFPELKTFMEKLNSDANSNFVEDCQWNDDWKTGECNCENVWHLDGFVVSLLPGKVESHKDIADSCYLQIIGKSFWKIDELNLVELLPGDVIFVSKMATHEVWGDGPRCGILVMDKRKGNKR